MIKLYLLYKNNPTCPFRVLSLREELTFKITNPKQKLHRKSSTLYKPDVSMTKLFTTKGVPDKTRRI